jgi:hypothetical protein
MEKMQIENPRYPHYVKIVRIIPGKGEEDNPFADEEAEVKDETIVLYEGEGRSFTDTTTEGDNIVDSNKRKSSIPVRFNMWANEMKPLDGDTIYSTVGNNTEVGIIKDCESDNFRTLVYWNFRRV